MEAVLMLSEQGGDVLPPQRLIQNILSSRCSMGPSSWPAAVNQEPAANIWISPASTSWSHCSQHLGVPILNMWVSLFSATTSSHPQLLGPPALNMLVFPFSTSGFPCPELGRPRGFTISSLEDLTLHCFGFYLRLSGQGSMSQEGEEKVEERAVSKPQDDYEG